MWRSFSNTNVLVPHQKKKKSFSCKFSEKKYKHFVESSLDGSNLQPDFELYVKNNIAS